MNHVGARWWKFDIHTHTPASADYGLKKGSDVDTDVTPIEWLSAFINKGIECVAVTDHNTGSWIDKLKQAAESLRAEGHEIHVFPGVEVTANSNIHIIGIFDPSKSSQDIAAVVGACKFKGTYGDSNAVAEESAEKVAREIKSHGGIAIPAHIDLPAGMCNLDSHHTIRQLANESDAVEIIFPDRSETKLQKFTSLGLNIPSLIGSDCHRRSEIGRAFNWIKMAKPSIEGLKLALVDGHSSTIRSDSGAEHPNRSSDLLFHAISIENSRYAGRASPLILNFNPWLNSIIGGRGSGKSSLIEFIRIAMDRSRDILSLEAGNEIKSGFESFIKTAGARDADGVMLPNTFISCIYSKGGVYFNIRWSKETNKSEIYRYENENWVEDTGEVYSRFPLKIFSQKQIFDLAKNPDSLIRLIDESDEVNYSDWKSQWSSTKFEFLRLCADKDELSRKLIQKPKLQGELNDIKQKITAIENSGHKDILKKYQNYVSKIEKIEDVKRYLQDASGSLSHIISQYPAPRFDQEMLDKSVPEEAELKIHLDALEQYGSNWVSNIEQEISNLDKELNSFEQKISTSQFFKGADDAKEKYRELVKSLSEKGINDISEYDSLTKRRTELEKQIQELIKLEQEKEKTTKLVNEKYAEIVRLRKDLTLRRQLFLDTHLSGNDSIKIEIHPMCNEDKANDSFRRILGREDAAFASDIFDPDKESGFIYNTIKEIKSEELESIPELIDKRLEVVHRLKEGIFNFRLGHVNGTRIGKRFTDFLEQVERSTFDELNTWFPGDRISIRFKDGNRFKDVSQGSAGQKASTVLSFLLSYGTEPLVLDQPEDDLDNKLIYSLIVSNLQKNKPRRQMIIVTHNPNIVVNGDSEYVVALHSKGQIEVTSQGALQEANVRESVCEIMEGGEAALTQRYKRMIQA